MLNLLGFHRSLKRSQLTGNLGVRKKGLLLLSLLLMGFWSMALGIGIARAINHSTDTGSPLSLTNRDPSLLASSILERYKTAQQLYIDTCSGCHIPISPSVLPSESWKSILEKPDRHYGTSVDMIRITQVLLWEYLATFSRPVSRDEPVPLYISQSRYFKALHPRVDLPKPSTLKTCVTCHPRAQQYDYQTLSPEWDNAP
ncbi:low-redox potential cytochrome [Gloeothece verrucosa]|uniref:Diheme cytochrome c n=1 Tax=Gloeothece verrucosa (strain PCC 7822) TaxID=497965 RepID=E0U871_GLOV7|nr:low-redox potential cytochrome [Gloeothece verrucosa]ADN17276.1 Diheme cytochrome c [Gloeothece verrucosa PCC 7822]